MTILKDYFIFINIIIALIYLAFLYAAYKNGMLYELVNLLATVVSLASAYIAAPVLAELLPIISLDDELFVILNISYYGNCIIWFLAVLLLIRLLVFMLNPILKGLSKVPVLGFVNRLGGLLFGFINATIVVLLINLLTFTPAVSNGKEVRDKTLFSLVSGFTDQVSEKIAETIKTSGVEELIDIETSREWFMEYLKGQGITHE